MQTSPIPQVVIYFIDGSSNSIGGIHGSDIHLEKLRKEISLSSELKTAYLALCTKGEDTL